MYEKVYRLFLGDTKRGRHLLVGIALCVNSATHSTKHSTLSIRHSTTGWTFQNFSHAKRARGFRAYNASCAASSETSRAANFEIQTRRKDVRRLKAQPTVPSSHATPCYAMLCYVTLLYYVVQNHLIPQGDECLEPLFNVPRTGNPTIIDVGKRKSNFWGSLLIP